jgi:hypothetical protein
MRVGEPPKLETPASPDELYYARRSDVAEFGKRPTFTGDVLQLADGRLVCAVQHPCAMRTGIKRNPLILACTVAPFTDQIPDDWGTGHYKRMFFPDMNEQGNCAVEFIQMTLISPADIDSGDRVVILSAYGVNLLLQRWTYHNNRVVIPTMTINVQSAGPFEEADLVAEAYDELVAAGESFGRAEELVEAWLTSRPHAGQSQRDRLADAQARSTVRRELRTQVELWVRELEARRGEVHKDLADEPRSFPGAGA